MKPTHLKPLIAALFLAAGFAGPLPAHAGEKEQLEALRETTQAILDALVAKGILSADAAKDLVKQAEEKGQAKAEADAKEEAGVVRVPYIPEVVKQQISDQIRQEVVAQAKTERWGDVNVVPEWLDRLKWEGDIRLRAQSNNFASDNATPSFTTGFFPGSSLVSSGQMNTTGTINNTTEDQNQMSIRARLGLLAKVSDSVSAGFRLTTGNTTAPYSTNQTLGNGFNKYSLVLDRAYLKGTPWDWLELTGGRIPNPFFSTDLVWSENLNFDGLAATFKAWPQEPMSAKPFLTLGAFPLQKSQASPTNQASDMWLMAAQAGLDWHLGAYTHWRFGLAYYDYKNTKAVQDLNPYVAASDYWYSGSILSSRQKGNTMADMTPNYFDGSSNIYTWGLAADYRLLNLTTMVDLAQFDPVHVILTGDVVKNVGYNSNDVISRLKAAPSDGIDYSSYAARTLGWTGKVTVGRPEVTLPGDWQVFLGYRYLERDAVLDAFTDSDFGLGGTNNKGYFVGGQYGLDRNTWMTVRLLSTDQIDGPKYGVDVLQVDLNAKF